MKVKTVIKVWFGFVRICRNVCVVECVFLPLVLSAFVFVCCGFFWFFFVVACFVSSSSSSSLLLLL
jgi:hypothetical protein